MNVDFTIVQGKTFSRVVRWEVLPFVYKAISAISQAAPMAVTSASHGIVDGWPVAVVSVKGMTQANAKHAPPKLTDFRKVTVLDSSHVNFNDVNAADFDAYESGGYLQHYTPHDLAGYTARMSIKSKVGGTVLASTDDTIVVDIDDTTKTITITITAADTAELQARTNAVYELEMVVDVDGDDVVTTLLRGSINVVSEVTT